MRIMIDIEGHPFTSIRQAFKVAAGRGFAGSEVTFRRRLRDGSLTWAELTSPPSGSMAVARAALQAHRREERKEMAELCARLDARKADSRSMAMNGPPDDPGP